jgi:hypothetical protein
MSEGYWVQALQALQVTREKLGEQAGHLMAAEQAGREAQQATLAALGAGERLMVSIIDQNLVPLEEVQRAVAQQIEWAGELIGRLAPGG